jgi:hypothetical protein
MPAKSLAERIDAINEDLQDLHDRFQAAKEIELQTIQSRAFMPDSLAIINGEFDARELTCDQAKNIVKSFFYVLNLVGQSESAESARQGLYALYRPAFVAMWECKVPLGKKMKISPQEDDKIYVEWKDLSTMF